jgi:AraC family transcriptional regulator
MSSRPLPESCSHLAIVFEGELFTIGDWRCGGLDTPAGGEEWSGEDRIVVTRRGAWELDTEGVTRRADPVTVTLWNGGAYRVRHPVRGGDRCTAFRLTRAGTAALRASAPVRGRRHARRTFTAPCLPLDGQGYLAHRRALASAGDALAVEEAGLAFLRRIAAHLLPERHTAPPMANRYADRARDLIASEFRSPLTVAGIARAVHCSPFHLGRIFRRATGMTLHRAVVRLRLREGLERLLDGPASVAAVALDVGFASHSHFTDAFRSEFGCPPSAARRDLLARRLAGEVSEPYY